MEHIEKLKKTRAEKLEKIKKLGINPYPSKSDKQKEIAESLKLIGKSVKTAGRIMGIRGHGGSSFVDLKDESGTIQLFFSKSQLSKVNGQLLELLDIGDFIEVEGKVDKTQAGQLTIFVTKFSLLTKSVRPLPSTWYGLKDVEEETQKSFLVFLKNEGVGEFLKSPKSFFRFRS